MQIDKDCLYFHSDVSLYAFACSSRKAGDEKWETSTIPHGLSHYIRTSASPLHAQIEQIAFTKKGYHYGVVPINALELESFIKQQGGSLNIGVGYAFAAMDDRLLVEPDTGIPPPLMVYKPFPMNGIPLQGVSLLFGDEFIGFLERVWRCAGVTDYGDETRQWEQQDSNALDRMATEAIGAIRHPLEWKEGVIASHYALYDPATHQWRFADLDLLRQHGTA